MAFGIIFATSGCLGTVSTPSNNGGGSGGGSAGGSGAVAGGGGSVAGGGGTTSGSGVSGTISADATWTGVVEVSDSVTVASGVTLTIADGALIKVATGKGIIVNGTLKLAGSAAVGVKLQPDPMPGSWDGIQIMQGGSLAGSYAELDYSSTAVTCATGAAACAADHLSVMNFSSLGMMISSSATFDHLTLESGGGGGLYVSAGASDLVKVTNSIFHATGGDAVTADSGNFTFQFNHSYGNGGATPLVHCASHLDTTGTLLVDHNDFDDATYGFMASNMNPQSKVNYNNYSGNAFAYGPASGAIDAGADLSKNYWGSATPPTIMGNTTNQKSAQGMPVDAFYTTPVTGTGPQP
jgi:hypothetical protein